MKHPSPSICAVLFLVGYFGAMTACDGIAPNAEQKDKIAVARQMSQYGTAQPVPAFDLSLERDTFMNL